MKGARYVGIVISLLTTFAIATSAAICPVISEQPRNATIYPCQEATFRVTANGTLPISFQWFRDGNAVPGATSLVYSVSCCGGFQSGFEYFVIVSNSCGAVTSVVAHLNYLLDVVPPTLVGATALADMKHVVLDWFPCPLNAPVANNSAIYGISGGAFVSNATVVFKTNIVLITSPLAPATRYEVTVEYMEDVEGNFIMEPVTIGFWTLPHELSFLRTNDLLQLDWPTNAVLQQSLTITGVWSDVSNTLGTITISNGPTRFFRVRFP